MKTARHQWPSARDLSSAWALFSRAMMEAKLMKLKTIELGQRQREAACRFYRAASVHFWALLGSTNGVRVEGE